MRISLPLIAPRFKRKLSVTVAALLLTLTACGSGDRSTDTSASATSAAPIHAVKVLANPQNCDAQPLIVDAGTVVITATSTANIPISISLFAPQDGAFLKRLARIRALKPNDTKTMTVELAQGAYEITCGTEELTSRKRITAI